MRTCPNCGSPNISSEIDLSDGTLHCYVCSQPGWIPDAPMTNASRQSISRERRSKAYIIVKAQAFATGAMADKNDLAGLDYYMDRILQANEGNLAGREPLDRS